MNKNKFKLSIFKQNYVSAVALTAFFLLCSGAFVINANATSDFPDVSHEDWFYPYIQKLDQCGFINGYPDGSFKPHSPVSRAEFIKLVTLASGKISNCNGSCGVFSDVSDEKLWFSPYVCAALSDNIFYAHEFPDELLKPEEKITRVEAAKILGRSIDMKLSPLVSPFSDCSDIYAVNLYEKGIFTGEISDGKTFFNPDDILSRAQCCALVSRFSDYMTGTLSLEKKPKLQLIKTPEMPEEFYIFIDNMLNAGTYSATFEYPSYGFYSASLADVKKNYLDAFRSYGAAHPEFASLFSSRISTSGNYVSGTVSVSLEIAQSLGTNLAEIESFAKNADSAAAQICAEIITPEMSDLQKANAIHDYLVSSCAYDTAENHSNSSYLAYGALVEKKAVCQGYAAAFNLLCSLSDVKSVAVSDGEHMWNIVFSHGVPYLYDTTWDDPIPDKSGEIFTIYKSLSLDRIPPEHPHNRIPFDTRFIF